MNLVDQKNISILDFYVLSRKLKLCKIIFNLSKTVSFIFAQWRYSNQWSIREVLLLLVENWYQYPGLMTWNTVIYANFWRFHKKPKCIYHSNLKTLYSEFINVLKEILEGYKYLFLIPSSGSPDNGLEMTFITTAVNWKPNTP